MNRFRFILWLFFAGAWPQAVLAQCKTFKLSDRGDTLNCTDAKGMRQGAWLVRMPELRGNPGYDEEGYYKDDKKEGIWRKYTLEGDLMAVESYRWGLLNGKSQYYSVLGLEREEGWWAINPAKMWDTIDVPDLYEDGIFSKAVIKNEGRSLKHGSWNWYDPMTGRIVRSEEYIRDSSVSVAGSMGVKSKPKNTGPNGQPLKPGQKTEKPAVVLEYEKKNAGKKKINVRDGSTGY